MFDVPQTHVDTQPVRKTGLRVIRVGLYMRWVQAGIFACALGLYWAGPVSVRAQVLAPVPTWPAVVTWVSDGDTVWVQDSLGATHKVRLQGIDAPEICQDHGLAAKEALQQLLMGQHVTVQGHQVDDYGRLLARLYMAKASVPDQMVVPPVPQAASPTSAQRHDVGRWMVQRGHAWSYRYRNDPGPYAQEEQRARASQLGLFASGQAQRPRDFRRHHGPCHEPWVPHS